MTQDEFNAKFSLPHAKSDALSVEQIRDLVTRDAALIQRANEMYTDQPSYVRKREVAGIAFKRVIVAVVPHEGNRYLLGPFLELSDIYAGKREERHIKSFGLLATAQLKCKIRMNKAGYFDQLIRIKLDDQ